MKWTDTHYIAETLYDTYPDIQPENLRFTDFLNMILALPNFEDTADNCNEWILEAILQAWLDEKALDN